MVAVGGRATSTSSGETDSTNTVEGNTRTNRVAVIQQQPAVATALKVLLGAGEEEGRGWGLMPAWCCVQARPLRRN